MTEFVVAIVGLGSRGLSVLERIVALARMAGPAAAPVRIEIIDPTCTGTGVHDTGQPDYLLLNTTCGKVSMFPDAYTVGSEVDRAGPNLYEWVTERGLRLAEDGFGVGRIGRPIRPTDFLPRRILGDYLGWFLDQVRQAAPDHVRLTMHVASAVDISSGPDGGLSIDLSDGSRVHAGYAFLTTGYTANNGTSDNGTPNGGAGPAGRRFIAEPYPLPERTAVVAPGESVAVGGFGLSAMDLMSCLTVGRGGRFVRDGDGLRYVASGLEPTLLMYSRSGVPCRARPMIVEFGPRYRPLVFTTAAVDALRADPAGPLDFDQDLLPLVRTEMRIAYRRCQARLNGGDAGHLVEQRLAGTTGPAQIGAVLDEMDAELGLFDAAGAFDGSTGMPLSDSESYQRWLAGVVAADLAEGRLGYTGSPLKAALDILRDLRDTFRHAVDFGGLTARSLDEFTSRTVPALNRAVVGPQYERHAELLALLAAGVVRVPFGPDPQLRWHDAAGRWTISSGRLTVPYSCDVDWLASAHVAMPAVESSASPLITALYRKGVIRPHRPASRYVHGIDVDADQHPLDARGRPERRLWVLGPLCEGATFYNNLVPSPSGFSRPVFDAHRCAAAAFAAERARRVAATDVSRQPVA